MGKVSRRREGAGMETQQNDFPAPHLFCPLPGICLYSSYFFAFLTLEYGGILNRMTVSEAESND